MKIKGGYSISCHGYGFTKGGEALIAKIDQKWQIIAERSCNYPWDCTAEVAQIACDLFNQGKTLAEVNVVLEGETSEDGGLGAYRGNPDYDDWAEWYEGGSISCYLDKSKMNEALEELRN